MRVFLTGATGFVGSAILPQLLSAGHDVLGLARTDKGAQALERLGVAVHRGDLTDPDTIVAGARAADGVIHTAYVHDFSKFEENAVTDRRVVEAMLAALEGTGKPFVLTSGTAMLPRGRIGTEIDGPPPDALHRAGTEAIALAAADRGVRVSIVRLSPTVHGAGDHGFLPMLIDIARKKGVAAYVGDGGNRWPAVHRHDAATLYRLAVERAPAGTRFHAAAEEGVPMREIAETIAAGLGVPARGIPAEEAGAHFGFLGGFVGMDNPTSSAWTRATFGWNPEQPGLLADLRENYFGG